jgi:hypothetical protein
LFAERPFGERPFSGTQNQFQQLAFGDLLNTLMQMVKCATRFYEGRFAGDLAVSASLTGVKGKVMTFFDDYFGSGFEMNDFRCLSDRVLSQRLIDTAQMKTRTPRS